MAAVMVAMTMILLLVAWVRPRIAEGSVLDIPGRKHWIRTESL